MSRILEEVRFSYYCERSALSPDGHTLALFEKVSLLELGMRTSIQIQITEESREEYQFMIFGLGSLDLIRRSDGYCDESQISTMINKFNSSHNKPISLGINRNGEFLLMSVVRFNGLSANPTENDIMRVCNYAHDMVDFFKDKYKEIQKIVKYFGFN